MVNTTSQYEKSDTLHNGDLKTKSGKVISDQPVSRQAYRIGQQYIIYNLYRESLYNIHSIQHKSLNSPYWQFTLLWNQLQLGTQTCDSSIKISSSHINGLSVQCMWGWVLCCPVNCSIFDGQDKLSMVTPSAQPTFNLIGHNVTVSFPTTALHTWVKRAVTMELYTFIGDM